MISCVYGWSYKTNIEKIGREQLLSIPCKPSLMQVPRAESISMDVFSITLYLMSPFYVIAKFMDVLKNELNFGTPLGMNLNFEMCLRLSQSVGRP